MHPAQDKELKASGMWLIQERTVEQNCIRNKDNHPGHSDLPGQEKRGKDSTNVGWLHSSEMHEQAKEYYVPLSAYWHKK